MKLKKIVKHIDSYAEVKLYDLSKGYDPVWSGSMLLLQIAANVYKDKEDYLKDCDHTATISAIRSAEPYLDYHLDTNDDGGAINVEKGKVSEYGFFNPQFTIYIKKKKGD